MTRYVLGTFYVSLSLSFLAIAGCSGTPSVSSPASVQSARVISRPVSPIARIDADVCLAREIYFPEPFEPEPAREVLSPAVRVLSESIACVRGKLAEAREAHAAPQAACLNDKLNQLGFALRSFDERVEKLERALSKNTLRKAAQEYASLKSICERSRTVVSEVETCTNQHHDSALASFGD